MRPDGTNSYEYRYATSALASTGARLQRRGAAAVHRGDVQVEVDARRVHPALSVPVELDAEPAALHVEREAAGVGAAIADLLTGGKPARKDSPREIEDDWLTIFSEVAGHKSDRDIQRMLARMLVGEIRKPGSFSNSDAGSAMLSPRATMRACESGTEKKT